MNDQARKALELARAALEWPAEHDADTAIAAIDAALTAPDLNLSDTAVQKRLAAQWGYMPAPAAPVAQDAEKLAREAHGYIREQMTAWDRENLHDCIDKLAGIEIPKSAPAAPVAQPLTDEQARKLRDQWFEAKADSVSAFIDGLRAGERAHGIGQEGGA